MQNMTPAVPVNLIRLCLILACLCAPVPGMVYAQDDNATGFQVSPLFSSHEPLSLRISAPFSDIFRSRGLERPYQAGTVTLTGDDGRPVDVEVEVRVRGKSRAKSENCRIPPLRLNFPRKSLDHTVFEGEDKLKLVTHCKDSDSYEQYVLLEYLNYRVLELFSPYTMRVRQVQVDYHDSERDKDLGTHVGIFLEDSGRMEGRLGLEELKTERMQPREYDPDILAVVELFEYFIGNTDYSVVSGPQDEDCCHNIIPLRGKAGGVIPVPYDFDSTGVVDPPYATVNDLLKIKSVRTRLYRGFCQDGARYQRVIDAFLEQRDAIRSLYQNQPGLSARSRDKALNYYDAFYDTVTDEKQLQRNILGKCREIPR